MHTISIQIMCFPNFVPLLSTVSSVTPSTDTQTVFLIITRDYLSLRYYKITVYIFIILPINSITVVAIYNTNYLVLNYNNPILQYNFFKKDFSFKFMA